MDMLLQTVKQERLTNKELILKNKDHAFNIWFIYALTLSIFPGFLYENTGEHQLGAWYVTFRVIFLLRINIQMK